MTFTSEKLLPPRFLYFDMGNVLLGFDHEVGCRQMAEAAGVSPEKMRRIVFESDLLERYERGDVDSEQFYEIVSEQVGARPDRDRFAHAAGDIFTFRPEMAAITSQLRFAGWRIGVLSNTNDFHWRHVWQTYAILRTFHVYALSFELRSLKPEPEIYKLAAEASGCTPQQIFFTDDRPENVAAATAAGYDAVLFRGAQELAADLRARGVRFNY